MAYDVITQQREELEGDLDNWTWIKINLLSLILCWSI